MIPTIPGERVERVVHGHNFLSPHTRRDLALNLHALHERSQKHDSSTQQTGQIMSRTDTQEPTTTRVEAADSPKGVRPVGPAASEIDPIDTPGVQHNQGDADGYPRGY